MATPEEKLAELLATIKGAGLVARDPRVVLKAAPETFAEWKAIDCTDRSFRNCWKENGAAGDVFC